jgi:hypothetical protein
MSRLMCTKEDLRKLDRMTKLPIETVKRLMWGKGNP